MVLADNMKPYRTLIILTGIAVAAQLHTVFPDRLGAPGRRIYFSSIDRKRVQLVKKSLERFHSTLS